jgi:hypothetical protein
MAVNDRIYKTDYNNIRNKVVGILGTGSGNSGYGQPLRSSAVSESDKVTINEWANLYYDIVNCYVHQTAAAPGSPTSAVVDTLIRHSTDATVITASISGNYLYVYGVTSGMVAVGQTISGAGITPPGAVISLAMPQQSITVSSFGTKTGTGPYYVTLSHPTEPLALSTADRYTIAGNSNPLYNGRFTATASTTTSITLQYDVNPGTYGSGTTTITSSAGNNPWGRSVWLLSSSLPAVSARTLNLENTSSNYPMIQYDGYADTIVTNKFNIAGSQGFTTAYGTTSQTWPGVYGSYWNSTISCTITVQWTTAAAARYFFNSGGEIRFTSSLTGSTANAQTIGWTTLLSGAGIKAFGGNKPGTGTSPSDNTNFYRLTNSYSVWTSSAGSGAYTSNLWRIQARCNVVNNTAGGATQIEFLVQWVDGYVDPGIAPIAPPGATQTATASMFPPGDEVYGTVNLSVSTLAATGTLVPPGAGSFTVTQPTITLGGIAP